MSVYTADITTYVQANFPTPDYAVAAQTQLIALGEACAGLVVPTASADQRIVAIEELIEANAYFNQVPKTEEYYEDILEFCEYSLNLAVTANSPATSGALKLYSQISQAGANNPPTFDNPPNPNTMGEVPVWSYDQAGVYNLDFASTTPFLDAENVEITLSNHAFDMFPYATILAPNQLSIDTSALTAPAGVLTATLADNLLSGVQFGITVYA